MCTGEAIEGDKEADGKRTAGGQRTIVPATVYESSNIDLQTSRIHTRTGKWLFKGYLLV